MESELKFGQTDLVTKDNIRMERKMAKELWFLQMDLNIQEHLLKIIQMGMVYMNGRIKENILEIGKEIKCMVEVL